MIFILFTACMPVLVGPDVTYTPWTAPDNSWPISAPPEGLVGEGFEKGEVVPDFLLMDQYGQDVSLWQFYGSVIVMDVSTMWCGPCGNLADTVQEIADSRREQGFVYMTLFPEDVDKDAEDPTIPDIEDLNAWGDYHEIAEPLLSDDARYTEAITTDAFPVIIIIDREMKASARLEGISDDGPIVSAVDALL